MSGKKHLQNSVSSILVFDGKEYPRLDCGLREVRVREIQGPEWVRPYRRWSLRVGCHMLDEPGEVSAFFNLGSDPSRPSMGKGRQSKIYKLVKLALGRAPRRGEKVDFNLLLVDKCFVVRIEDCKHDSDGQAKDEGEVYSRITEFVKCTGP